MLLKEKEKKKYDVISDVVNGIKTKKEAEKDLELSRKQINRLIVKFNEEGRKGFIHKLRGRKSTRKTPDEEKNKIINLYLTEYYDYNFSHFYYKTRDQYESSFQNVCNILTEADIISPEAQRKTVKEYNAKMRMAIKENKINDEQKELFDKRIKLEKEKSVRKSTLLYHFGQEIQMDAAFYNWFGDVSTALHLAVDRATKKVLYGWFDYQETTRAYFILLMNTVIHYGIPSLVKTDKRGSFSINTSSFNNSKINITQFGRICKELGIKLDSKSNPLFKPNVERENKTFKGRLKAELRHEGITTIEEANKYLTEVFIPDLNKQFSYDIDDDKNDMQDNIYTEAELNIIISEQYERIIDNASSITYKYNYYIPADINTGETVKFKHRTKCIVVIAYDKSIWAFIEEKLYALVKIDKPESSKPKKVNLEPGHKGHKPAQNHSWTYEEQMKSKKKYQELKKIRKMYD